jgi:hypothetical protein
LFFYNNTAEKGSSVLKTYWFSTRYRATWIEAKVICNSYGMKFLTLDTSEEADAFLKLCRETRFAFDFIHVGALTNLPKDKTQYSWVETGKKVNYALKWAPGERNNTNEMCLAIGKWSMLFDGMPCNGLFNHDIVCQFTTNLNKNKN